MERGVPDKFNDNRTYRGTANSEMDRELAGLSGGRRRSRRRRKAKTFWSLPKLGRLRHSLSRSTPDLVVLALFLPFLGFLTLGWNILVSHAPHLVGLLAMCVAAVAFAFSARLAAGVWAITAVLLFLPLVSGAFRIVPPPGAGCRLTALTFNSKLSRGRFEDEVARIVAEQNADVVFLQEIGNSDAFAGILRAKTLNAPYHLAPNPTNCGVILTRFPVVEGKAYGSLSTAVVSIAGREVRLATA
jgi:hypothetical protein